jgi:hypothetical protein
VTIKPKRKRKLDSLHVRLDETREKKLTAIMDHLACVAVEVNPSQAIRYAIDRAFERMEKPAA